MAAISPNLRFQSLTLAAGQIVRKDITGTFLICTKATASFKLGIGTDPMIPFEAGLSIREPGDTYFTSVILENIGLVDNTIEFYAGTREFTSNLLNIIADVSGASFLNVRPAPTYAKGSGIVTLATAASQTFAGVDGSAKRKQFTVRNLDGALDLQILDAAAGGNVLYVVKAGESFTLETSASLTVLNATGYDISFVVGETFYV